MMFMTLVMFLNALIGYLASFKIKNLTPKHPTLILSFHPLKSSKLLLHQVLNKKFIVLSILGISWLWFLGSIFMTSIPIILSDIFNLNNQHYTIYLVLFTAGVSTGSFACKFLLRNQITSKYVPVSLLSTSFLIFDLSYSMINHNLMRFYFDLFLIAFFGGIYSVPLYAILQHQSSEKNRSQNIAVNNIFNSIFIIGASVLLYSLQSLLKLDFASIFSILGILNLSTAIYSIFLLPETVIKFALKKLFRILFRVEIKGLENYISAGEKTIIVANHTSYLDPALINVMLPDQLIYAIDTEQSQKWWVKPLLKLVETYPVDPKNPLALKNLVKSLKDGKRVVIFPEGRITTTGSLMKVYEGPAMVASRADAKILPIKISGAEFTHFSKLQKILNLRMFPKIALEILPAKKITIDNNLSIRNKREEAGRQLYDIMSDLLFLTTKYYSNISELICESARKFGPKTEILEDSNKNRFTYKKLLISSIATSTVIPRSESRIGIMMPNIAPTVILYLATQFANKTTVMLNYTAGAKNISSAAKTSQIKFIITSQKFIETLELTNVIHELEKLCIKIIYIENLKNQISIYNKFFSIIKYYQIIYLRQFKLNNSRLNSESTILFTSGSEGSPKGVVLSNKNIQANIAQASSRIDINPTDVVLNVLPIFHCYGLTGATLLPLSMGVKVFLYLNPLHYRIVPEIAYDIGATIIFGTNTFLANYAKFAHPYDFYKIRYAIAGAEKLQNETQNLWSQKFGIRILEGYGTTETAPVISINTPMYYKDGTVGRIFPAIQYKLKKIPGIKIGGELHVKGPNIMLGYITEKRPDQLLAPPDGYHNTGDIAEIDNNGFLKILGRVKRFAKVGGEMVSLSIVEDLVNKNWNDYQNAVVSIHSNKGEKITLFTTNKHLLRTDLVKCFKNNGLPEIYIPKQIFYIKKLPTIGSGKTDYLKLQTEQ